MDVNSVRLGDRLGQHRDVDLFAGKALCSWPVEHVPAFYQTAALAVADVACTCGIGMNDRTLKE